MNAPLRHRCRNPHCGLKLPAPVNNHHHAFCTRGCHTNFYRSRCLVCEDPMRRRREGQRIKSGHGRCSAEYRKFPHVYSFPLPKPQISDECSRSADKTGTKFGITGYPPTARCLRDWWWDDPGIGDLSLYDKDGLTLARLVLGGDGHHHLRSPVLWPRTSWPDLAEARRQAEAIALASLPVDSKTGARVKKDSTTPHPMGPPFSQTDGEMLLGASSKIAETKTDSGIDTAIPDFLRRAAS
jgi:hypothetical protein